MFASTMAILDRACWLADVRLVWRENVAEGTHYTVRAGALVETERFKVPVPVWMTRKASAPKAAAKSASVVKKVTPSKSTKVRGWTGGSATKQRQNERPAKRPTTTKRVKNFEQESFDVWWAAEQALRSARRGAAWFDREDRIVEPGDRAGFATFDDPDEFAWAPQSEAWEGA